jgi:hypothetical protein
LARFFGSPVIGRTAIFLHQPTTSFSKSSPQPTE